MISEILRDTLNAIHVQREEILRAFVAQYGCEPDEVEQVEQNTPTGKIWFVRKRDKTIDENLGDIDHVAEILRK